MPYNSLDYYSYALPQTLFPQVVVNGTSAAETLLGTAGRDAISGMGGADTLVGGGGDDTYIVQYRGVGIVEQAGGGVDTVKTTTNMVLADNVENMIILGKTGYSGTTGVGNGGANLIVGDANNQFIEGGAGNDALIGGGGTDTFIFGAGSGYDAINDFKAGSLAAGGDIIRLRDYSISNFADMQSRLTQQGADTIVTLSASDAIRLRNVDATTLTADNFQFGLDRSHLKLSFDEEFNDPISWYNQTTKQGTWLPEFGYNAIGSKASHDIAPYTGEQQIYADPAWTGTGTTPMGLNPFTQKDGVFSISSKLIPAELQASLWDFNYYSGMLSTVKSFSQQYGYFEMRAKLPAQSGAWPAFWLHTVTGGTPPEIDILELYGKQNDVAHTSLHDTSLPNNAIGNTIYVPDASTAFHTYGVLWTADKITWYIDNAQVYQQDTPADLHQPAYMVLNLPIGGLGGALDDNNLPSGYDIDYVHAYTIDTAPPPVPGLTLTGTAAGETLTGGAGADTINGAGGIDTMVGLGGDDTYYIDNARDIVVEAAGGGTDTVNANAPWTATAGSSIEKLVAMGSGPLNLTGNENSMEIWGNTGINRLDDGGAADKLFGLGGNDIYLVHNAATVVNEDANGGYDAVLTTLSAYKLPDNVEKLTFIGSGDFSGTGNALANVITGGAGNDVLDGGGGADRLVGGLGNDTYMVDDARDVVIELPGEGTDRVLTALATYRAPENVETTIFTGTGSFIGMANTTGGRIIGGTGADTLNGAASGSDVLDGGGGADQLVGGKAEDTFVLNAPGNGVDRIVNFAAGQDHIAINAASFGLPAHSPIDLLAGAATAPAGQSALLYNGGSLYWDAVGGDGIAPVLLATVDGVPTLTASDFLFG